MEHMRQLRWVFPGDKSDLDGVLKGIDDIEIFGTLGEYDRHAE
ncbi:MAG: hypothetical protein ACE5FT_02025 [Candidatus Nanoarchaeia archaeon]